MTGPAITFDTGALIALERRKERAMKVYTLSTHMPETVVWQRSRSRSPVPKAAIRDAAAS